jgi:hypothetical protein
MWHEIDDTRLVFRHIFLWLWFFITWSCKHKSVFELTLLLGFVFVGFSLHLDDWTYTEVNKTSNRQCESDEQGMVRVLGMIAEPRFHWFIALWNLICQVVALVGAVAKPRFYQFLAEPVWSNTWIHVVGSWHRWAVFHHSLSFRPIWCTST